VPIAKRSNGNRHLHLRRGTKFLYHGFAQSLGIALSGFCKIHDLVCEHFLGRVAAIGKSKRHQGHLECKAHDPDRLRIEFLAIEVGPDWHGNGWAERASAIELIEHLSAASSVR
jgi:hypothetical protein